MSLEDIPCLEQLRKGVGVNGILLGDGGFGKAFIECHGVICCGYESAFKCGSRVEFDRNFPVKDPGR